MGELDYNKLSIHKRKFIHVNYFELNFDMYMKIFTLFVSGQQNASHLHLGYQLKQTYFTLDNSDGLRH